MPVVKAGKESSGVEIWCKESCTREGFGVGEIVIPRVRGVGTPKLKIELISFS